MKTDISREINQVIKDFGELCIVNDGRLDLDKVADEAVRQIQQLFLSLIPEDLRDPENLIYTEAYKNGWNNALRIVRKAVEGEGNG